MNKCITVIGDTHGCHHHLKLHAGYMLMHTGDVTAYGTEPELYDFLDWFAHQPFQYKLFVAGNHDLCLDVANPPCVNELPKSVIYLQNQSVTIDDIQIFGSPISPYQAGMAFNRHRGKAIDEIWKMIPSSTDILITHSPPFGVLSKDAGCEDLMKHVERVQPKLHLFGHVHEGYGQMKNGRTLFVNAALCNSPDFMSEVDYRLIRKEQSVILSCHDRIWI